MPIQEGLFWARDGERIFYRFQAGSPDKNPILLVHGHGEHSGRYLKFFTRLEDLEHPLLAFDLRGCGRSSGAPVHVSRFEDYFTDITGLLDFLSDRFKIQGPVILVGHSLGGLIATGWARENPERVSKLILSSPLFGLPHEGGTRILAKVLNRIVPTLVVHNPVSPPFLTHDLEEVERYRKDPLIQRRITVRLAYEMVRYMSLFREKELVLPFPVYILMAGEDHVVWPEATHRFFSRLRAPRKELEVFDGFFHEIFNEMGQDKAFERLKYYLARP